MSGVLLRFADLKAREADVEAWLASRKTENPTLRGAAQAGARRVLVHYEWAEPGDPPNPNYSSVRAKPLAKPVAYPSVTPEAELDLIRRYHEDGDLDALEQLIGAHRPMVVRMAKTKWRGNGTTLRCPTRLMHDRRAEV